MPTDSVSASSALCASLGRDLRRAASAWRRLVRASSSSASSHKSVASRSRLCDSPGRSARYASNARPLRDAMRISAPAASCTRKAPSTWRFSSVKGSPAQSFVRGCHFHVFFTTVETATSRPVRTVASRLQTSGGFMLTDARGCPTSTPSSASLQQYERALDLCASYELDPLATIQKALDADPTFALGHCLRAGL